MEVKIIFPSSSCQDSILSKTLDELKEIGFFAHFEKPEPYLPLPFFASSVKDRVSELTRALLSSSKAPLLCARGGYGASDLLSYLPWEKLKDVTPKFLVGFSDISALQSALFTKLNWPSIHGPMPGTDLWGKNGAQDIEALYALLREPHNMRGEIQVRALTTGNHSPQGWLFGGCMSVLCNLIGTPYFPHSLKGAILFLEDTGEAPGRILRMLNQFILSGSLEGVSALVLGDFGEIEHREALRDEIAKRLSLPVYVSKDFGHLSPNFPLVLGAKASIGVRSLHWSYGE
jgi:muramoyltetrapeptide carboxypeptidase